MSASEMRKCFGELNKPFHLLTRTMSNSETVAMRELKKLSRNLGGRGSFATQKKLSAIKKCLEDELAMTV